MRLQLNDKFNIKELRDWVFKEQPKKIVMNRVQYDWYLGLVRQHCYDRPIKFFNIPVKMVELTDEE